MLADGVEESVAEEEVDSVVVVAVELDGEADEEAFGSLTIVKEIQPDGASEV